MQTKKQLAAQLVENADWVTDFCNTNDLDYSMPKAKLIAYLMRRYSKDILDAELQELEENNGNVFGKKYTVVVKRTGTRKFIGTHEDCLAYIAQSKRDDLTIISEN